MKTVVICIAIIIGLVVVRGSMLIKEDAKECAAKGGVQVKKYDGFACIKATEIKP